MILVLRPQETDITKSFLCSIIHTIVIIASLATSWTCVHRFCVFPSFMLTLFSLPAVNSLQTFAMLLMHIEDYRQNMVGEL